MREILGELGLKKLEIAKKKASKTSIGRELINNLLFRLERRNNNLMIEMDGYYVKKVRINLSSNFFAPKEKNFAIWVKPFVRDKYLMLNWDGVVIRASDIFGNSINYVNL